MEGGKVADGKEESSWEVQPKRTVPYRGAHPISDVDKDHSTTVTEQSEEPFIEILEAG